MALKKRDFPLIDVRRHLETGPILLVTSKWQGRSNIMTMGWQRMVEFSPALVGCYIWEGNRSHLLPQNAYGLTPYEYIAKIWTAEPD